MKPLLLKALFAARYNLFEILVVSITLGLTNYTFDDTYDAYMFVAALMILIWGSTHKIDCKRKDEN